MTTEEDRIRQWRASLAEELDSDEEELDFKPGSGARPVLGDYDLGLDLMEPPVSRLDAPPPRQTRAPVGITLPHDGQTLEAKVRALEAKLQEKDLELEAQPTGEATTDVREAKVREIARRSKAAMVALHRERAKNAQLATELAAARQQQQGGGGGVAAGSGAA
eukprot:4224562-Prymnesium_polylepis.1